MRKLVMLALSLLGLFDSTYLWWVYTSPSRPLVCLGGGGCDAVRASTYAHLWGHPLPIFGVAMYAALALLVFSQPLGLARWAPARRYLVATLSGCGFLFSVYLTGLEGRVIHAWCAWCVVSALTVTAIFVLSVWEIARPAPEPEPAEALAQARTHFAVCIAALIVGIPAFYTLSHHGESPSTVQQASEAVIRERLIRPDSHVSGNPQAPVTIVEFGDFQCPACGREQEVIREIRQKYGDQICWVFRQFPIPSLHPFAEAAAMASECAADQGKFWEAVDKLYENQTDLSNDALRRYAAELGLDTERFNQCLNSEATLARVHRDLDDAHALGVRGTPSFFVNQQALGRPPTAEELTHLIDQALGSRRPVTAQTQSPGETPDRLQTHDLKAFAADKPDTSKASAPNSSASLGGSLETKPLLPSVGGGIFAQAGSPGCSEDELKQRQPALIRTPEAQRLFAGSPKALFVDVRSAKDFATERIPGAINIPSDQIGQRWNSLPKDRTIVLYEAGRPGATGLDVCADSRAAGRVLLTHEFSPDRVKVDEDGLANWERAGLPVER
jgi:protein-disulfide isomerase/rhodanese-related sulfurtransferase